jgi:hypothetical protein
MNKVTEKRESKRFKFRKLLRVSAVIPSKSGNIFEVHPHSFEIFSHDISEGGLRIDNMKQISANGLFKVQVELAKNNVIETFGKVTWIDRYQCGLNFLMSGQDFKKSVRQLALRTALNV